MLRKQISVVSPVRRFLKSITEVESLMLLGSRFQRRLPVNAMERVPYVTVFVGGGMIGDLNGTFDLHCT